MTCWFIGRDCEVSLGRSRRVLVAELPLPALSAADERLVVAGELEPQLGAVGGEIDPALLAGHRDGLITSGAKGRVPDRRSAPRLTFRDVCSNLTRY
jgi:hypothetical protein